MILTAIKDYSLRSIIVLGYIYSWITVASIALLKAVLSTVKTFAVWYESFKTGKSVLKAYVLIWNTMSSQKYAYKLSMAKKNISFDEPMSKKSRVNWSLVSVWSEMSTFKRMWCHVKLLPFTCLLLTL